MSEQDKILNEVTQSDYKYGFTSDIEQEFIPKGLNEDVIRIISSKKEEPEWLLEYRLNAFRIWQDMKMPEWAHLEIPEIDYQDIIYYAAPKQQAKYESLDEVDPELLDTFKRLGISLELLGTLLKSLGAVARLLGIPLKLLFIVFKLLGIT